MLVNPTALDKENQSGIQYENPEYFPPLVKRFQSLFIDQLFIVICMVIFSQLLSGTDEESSGTLKAVLFIGLFLIYEPFCMTFGCTIGNYISGIRVRKLSDFGKRINIFQSYIRFVVKILLGVISFFTVTADKSKRALHDMAAGSIMVYAKTNNPL